MTASLMFPDRIRKVRTAMANERLDGLFVTSGITRRYLTGFSGSAGYLFITQTATVLTTDSRYSEQAEEEATGWQVRTVRSMFKWLAERLPKEGIQILGFEAEDISFEMYSRLSQILRESGLDIELKPMSKLVAKQRAVKDSEDLALLIEAIKIGDKAFDNTVAKLMPGISERDAAWVFEQEVRNLGAEAVSFPTIIASGPNGSRPHHSPGSKLLEEGELIVFDCGAYYKGYCSDLTRTVVLGNAEKKERDVHSIVFNAQQEAIQGISVGINGSEADAIARKVIAEAGYGDNFGHSLGHGLGLEVHEEPSVGPNGTIILEEGMVFTVEPGIYIPGWGGVRIEDVVILKNGKCEVLSAASRREI